MTYTQVTFTEVVVDIVDTDLGALLFPICAISISSPKPIPVSTFTHPKASRESWSRPRRCWRGLRPVETCERELLFTIGEVTIPLSSNLS